MLLMIILPKLEKQKDLSEEASSLRLENTVIDDKDTIDDIIEGTKDDANTVVEHYYKGTYAFVFMKPNIIFVSPRVPCHGTMKRNQH